MKKGEDAQQAQKTNRNMPPMYFPASSAGEDDASLSLPLGDILDGRLIQCLLRGSRVDSWRGGYLEWKGGYYAAFLKDISVADLGCSESHGRMR